MAFDHKKFRKAKFSPRTEEIKVPELAPFFGPDENPVFKVRGLNGQEMYRVQEAVKKRTDLQAITSKLLSGEGAAIAEAIQEFYGAVPEEYVRRVEILILGCAEPALTHQDIMTFYKNYPTQAHAIATRILWLTGEGSTLGESRDSGETPESDKTS